MVFYCKSQKISIHFLQQSEKFSKQFSKKRTFLRRKAFPEETSSGKAYFCDEFRGTLRSGWDIMALQLIQCEHDSYPGGGTPPIPPNLPPFQKRRRFFISASFTGFSEISL